MRRRTFLKTLSTGTLTAAVGTPALSEATGAATTVDALEFDSTSSLLDANQNYLTDDSTIAVTAESTAYNEDADDNGDATFYDSDTPIPLVAVDGAVVGFGATLVSDQANFQSGNEEFLLNVWDAHLGGSGTVLFDKGHDQYHTLTDFGNMKRYAETQQNYTVTATSTLTDDLSGADAVWLTGPATAFSSSELDALSSFVADGGAVFIHDRADYQNQDETANLNAIADALGLTFRFNDDQVVDNDTNGGAFYKPTTTQFDTTFDYFADREGLEIDPGTDHIVDVVDIADGDTVDVLFDSGRREPIRVLGIDTPEKAANQQYETTQEWEGLESLDYLATWGTNATDYAKGELTDETVRIAFDDEEPGIFDEFGRLLAYIYYDDTDDGSRDAFYNRRTIENGYARIYSSGFSKHESFWDAENAARTNGAGLWGESDPANSTEIRNRTVEEVFLPTTTSVRTSSGAIDRSRVPVTAESTAAQSGGSVSYLSEIPLVGVDEDARVGVVGSPLVDEAYEADEGYGVDTSGYENFVLTTNLIDYLGAASGDVLIDGGHGQFSADYGLSSEDAAYYQRYLEGVGLGFEQVNTLTTDNLSRGRTLIVTSPPEAFSSSELDALSSFRDNGGSIILVGSSEASADAVANLNEVANALGSDLRVNADAVTDSSNNVNSDETVPTTTQFDGSFPLYDPYSGEGSIAVQTVHEDAAGDEYDNLNDEYVVFENPENASIDLTGYAVEDEADQRYEFPDGFTLGAGETVTLHTGSGTDTSTDLYWGSGSPIWNNSGDTVYVFDDAGTIVVEYPY
ncbi:lamin tail domain-containing protein [Halobacterium rubrum]|uniref:lamin tail domain-containing protein n=1 Tax=Halobacterium TaxID=2239 RepID=UPI001F3299DC|nr:MULTISPECIES: lamin tail domain-containing protein [Halobacterium]MDH5021828.1 lamin tail domain-containing protein [Halobacterium rubrum]